MGIMSKAFLKLNDLGEVKVAKAEPLGRLPQRNFGGLIRSEPVTRLGSHVARKSAGELGSISKAEMLPAGASYTSDSATGVSASERVKRAWVTRKQNAGYSQAEDAAKGATYRANRANDSAKTDEDYQHAARLHNHAEGAHRAAADSARESGMLDRVGYHEGEMKRHQQANIDTRTHQSDYNPAPFGEDKSGNRLKLGEGKGMTFGKALGFLGTMQALSKAKDAKGHGSNKRGEGGVAQVAEESTRKANAFSDTANASGLFSDHDVAIGWHEKARDDHNAAKYEASQRGDTAEAERHKAAADEHSKRYSEHVNAVQSDPQYKAVHVGGNDYIKSIQALEGKKIGG